MDSDTTVKIPYGYKRVPVGERAKYRDGLLLDNGKFTRIRKIYGEWPVIEGHMVVIRRCTVEQGELPGTENL